jgi:hypothetical protein
MIIQRAFPKPSNYFSKGDKIAAEVGLSGGLGDCQEGEGTSVTNIIM